MKKLVLLGIMLVLASCGPYTKVDIRDTDDKITVTTNQSVTDSSSLNITITPNVNVAR